MPSRKPFQTGRGGIWDWEYTTLTGGITPGLRLHTGEHLRSHRDMLNHDSTLRK